jgi:hypothetical protein
MRTDQLTTIFHDASEVELSFDVSTRTIVLELNEEVKPQRQRLCFELCAQVNFAFAYDPDDAADLDMIDYSLDDIFELREKTEAGSEERYFYIEFCDDTVIEIRCKRFWIEPIEGFEQYRNRTSYQ